MDDKKLISILTQFKEEISKDTNKQIGLAKADISKNTNKQIELAKADISKDTTKQIALAKTDISKDTNKQIDLAKADISKDTKRYISVIDENFDKQFGILSDVAQGHTEILNGIRKTIDDHSLKLNKLHIDIKFQQLQLSNLDQKTENIEIRLTRVEESIKKQNILT